MKLYLLLMLCAALASTVSLASNNLSFEQLKDRFQIKGEIFYTDITGKKILRRGGESKSWRMSKTNEKAEIEGNWGANANEENGVAIHSIWTLKSDGTVQAVIEEFGHEEIENKPNGEFGYKFTNLLKKGEYNIQDFSPVTWVSERPNKKERTIVRFTLNLRDEDDPKPLKDMPISGTDMFMSDNEGNVWAQYLSGSGKYMGMKTVRGALFFSYYPFSGAKEIGVAAGNKIDFKIDAKRTVTLQSKTDFLPADLRTIVYGIYVSGQKTDRWSSTHFSTSSTESNFLKHIQNKN